MSLPRQPDPAASSEVIRFDIPLHYTPALLRRAVFRFWWCKAARLWLGYLAVFATVYAAVVAGGVSSAWFGRLLAGAAACGVLILALVYIAHLRNTLGRYRAMTRPQGMLTLGDSRFTMASELGSMTLPWTAIAEIRRYPELWLVVFGEASFATLPLADFGEEAQAFVLARVRAAGGRVH